MTQDMERLVELQKVLLALRGIQEERERIPAEKETLEERRAHAEGDFSAKEATLEAHRAERRRLEAELADMETKLTRYKDQLMSVKTNKEYTAMLHEIESTKGHVSEHETVILKQMDRIEEEKREVARARQKLDASLVEVAQRGRELDERASRLVEEEAGLLRDRERLQQEISSDLLEKFNRVATVRDGTGVAEAVDERCSACHERLRPQIWHEVRHTDKVVTCDGCGRILYYAVPETGP